MGIGGGPINVALLIFVFSFPIKTAAFYSIITILFAQLSKLISIVMGVGFFSFNLSMLPPLIIGAILGGFIGAKLNKMLSEKTLICAFNVVQVMVDLQASNAKLRGRAIRIVQDLTGLPRIQVEEGLEQAGNSVKLAVFMLKSGLSAQDAKKILDENHGFLKQSLDTLMQ